MNRCSVPVKVRAAELATRAVENGIGLQSRPPYRLLGSIAQQDAVGIFDWSRVNAHARFVWADRVAVFTRIPCKAQP